MIPNILTTYKKKILVLSTTSDNASVVLWCLREAGYISIVVGNVSSNRALIASPLCNRFYSVPERYTFEAKSYEILSMLDNITRHEKIDVIIPSGFESIKYLSMYYNRLIKVTNIMPVPSLDSIEELHNKYSFSLFCNTHDIPHPKTYLLEDIKVLFDQQLPLNYPILTKPLNMSAGRGIKEFDNVEHVISYFKGDKIDNDMKLPILLQEYIPGEDIDFNGFARNGHLSSWTIQRTIEIPRNNKTPLKWIQFTQNDEVFNIGRSIVEKSKYSGPIHIDMRIDSRTDTVTSIEVNPRFWASTFYSICDGVNFIDVGIRLAFDNKYMVVPRYSNRIWGNFWKIPSLIVKKRDLKLIKFIPSFTFFQIKYIISNYILFLCGYIKKQLSPASLKGYI